MCFFLSLCVFLSKTVFPPTVSLQVPLWFPQSLSLQLRVTHHLVGRIPSLLTWGLFNFPWFNRSNFKKKLKWMFWLLGWWRAGWSLPGSLWFLSLWFLWAGLMSVMIAPLSQECKEVLGFSSQMRWLPVTFVTKTACLFHRGSGDSQEVVRDREAGQTFCW